MLDEVTARFSVIALSALIVLMTQPGRDLSFFRNYKSIGHLFDLIIVISFIWSAWWFFRVKEELWTGFYMATNSNVFAGLIGIISLILLTFRSWGWSLVIMALVFIAFGFSGPWLPGLLEHFGVNIRDFMQIVWYSFDGVFGRTTGLVADNVLIFLIDNKVLREDAYKIVQDCALKTWEGNLSFKDNLLSHPSLAKFKISSKIDNIFNNKSLFTNVDKIFKRVS